MNAFEVNDKTSKIMSPIIIGEVLVVAVDWVNI